MTFIETLYQFMTNVYNHFSRHLLFSRSRQSNDCSEKKFIPLSSFTCTLLFKHAPNFCSFKKIASSGFIPHRENFWENHISPHVLLTFFTEDFLGPLVS